MSLKTDNRECSCDQSNLHLHVEIENLKQRLLERERHIVKMETNFLKEAEKFPNGEFAALMDQLYTWQEKYSRLFEAHKRVQKVNQGLEDKLLKIVDKCETEKSVLNSEMTSLTKKLVEQQMQNTKMQEENERYRNDLSLAIQLLQCKPSNFVSQKFDALPPEFQLKVKSHVANKQRKLSDRSSGVTTKPEVKTIKVPIPTFPPTAMVYSLDKVKEPGDVESGDNKPSTQVDIVSAAIMAKILEEREKERLNAKHCLSCSCAQNSQMNVKYTQTDKSESVPLLRKSENGGENMISDDDTNSCNMDLSSPIFSIKTASRVDNSASNSSCSTTSASNYNRDLIDLNDYYSSSEDNNSGAHQRVSLLDDGSNDGKENSRKDYGKYKGPKSCSVRLRASSNNILLENAAEFNIPILYSRRHPSEEPLVHNMKPSSIAFNSNESNLYCAETQI